MEFPGQEPIPDSEVTIAEMLKQKGYATAAIGKWGLGHFGTTGDPNKQGFDLFFGYNCQAHAHSYYPGPSLAQWPEGDPLDNDPPVPGHARLAAGRRSQRSGQLRGLQGPGLRARPHDRSGPPASSSANKDGPFFLYFPSTHPPRGPAHSRRGAETLPGQVGRSALHPEKGGYTPHFTPRAAYAAMISRLDKYVGRIMAQLEKLGLDENTLVMFSSDNGTTHLEQEVDYKFFESVGPLRGLKGSLYEGGIRVPMIARWNGKIEPVARRPIFSRPSTTCCRRSPRWPESKPPTESTASASCPRLLGQPDKQKKHDFLYWEFPAYGGQQAVRIGDWKAVRQNMLQKKNPDPLKIELYNLAEDIGEQHDLAAEKPRDRREGPGNHEEPARPQRNLQDCPPSTSSRSRSGRQGRQRAATEALPTARAADARRACPGPPFDDVANLPRLVAGAEVARR